MNRREVLGALGFASAHALALAFGCGGAPRPVLTTRIDPGEIRTWLRDAVIALRAAGLGSPHALAVSHQRTTAAVDVLDRSVARARREGVVLAGRDRDGIAHEHVTSDVSADGVAKAARAMAAGARGSTPLRLPKPQAWSDGSDLPGDDKVLAKLAPLAERAAPSSRIIYQAALLDIDDARVWSVNDHLDLEQRLVRMHLTATRVAWAGTRPIVGEVAQAWTGDLDDGHLEDADLEAAASAALQLTTSGGFDGGEFAIALAPDVVAAIVDAVVHTLLTSDAARRPEVARRLALGANVASSAITLIDDPTVVGAYGRLHFDDEGELAVALPLVDRGAVVGKLGDRAGVLGGDAKTAGRGLRAGHLGSVVPSATHLRLVPGDHPSDDLLGNGFLLEGARGASIYPAHDRFAIAIDRAHEVRAGTRTGRAYADVELVGELTRLLASVSAASHDTRTIGFRTDTDGYARWCSIEAPYLAARGTLRARRSEA